MSRTKYSVPMISALALGPMPEFARVELGERSFQRALEASAIPYDVAIERRSFIPEAFLVLFLDAVAREAGQQWLASVWAPQISVKDYGNWGTYVLSAPNLRTAYQRAAHSLPLHATGLRLDLQCHRGLAEVSLRFSTMGTAGFSELPMPAIGAVTSIGRHFLGPTWVPRQIGLSIPRPPHGDRTLIEGIFGCPIAYEDTATRIWFDEKDLSATRGTALTSHDIVTYQDLVRERAAEIPETFAEQIQSIIRHQLSDKQISVDEVAEALGLAVRTLQRRLGEDGLTFRELSVQTRVQRAQELLGDGALSITDVALELGYSSPAHFTRMFREVTGQPPSVFQRQPLVLQPSA